jgi:hypothetical protein
MEEITKSVELTTLPPQTFLSRKLKSLAKKGNVLHVLNDCISSVDGREETRLHENSVPGKYVKSLDLMKVLKEDGIAIYGVYISAHGESWPRSRKAKKFAEYMNSFGIVLKRNPLLRILLARYSIVLPEMLGYGNFVFSKMKNDRKLEVREGFYWTPFEATMATASMIKGDGEEGEAVPFIRVKMIVMSCDHNDYMHRQLTTLIEEGRIPYA